MSAEANKAVARRYFEEVWGQGRLEVADELIAPHYVFHDPADPAMPPGPAGAKQMVGAFRAAFPDLQVIVEDLIAEGDKVALRLRGRGTHRGAFAGVAPTGRSVTLTSVELLRLAGGKLVEHWDEFDTLGVLQQLGALPAPRGGRPGAGRP